ncbi:MAG: HEAT repeat domain-containing protein [Phycisphaeraceae bacterium]|nr:MAG: HEAT repeat domain-containing protein [Phycisphaeraceae bacterium]
MHTSTKIRSGAGVITLALALTGSGFIAACAAQRSTNNQASFIDPLKRSELRERAFEMLLDAAASNDPLLRANAIEALQIAPGRVEPLVRSALHDDNIGVRYAAAMTVGKLQLHESAPFVEPLLNDPDRRVRAGAIFALHQTTGKVDPSPLAAMLEDRDPQIRALGAFVLGEMGDASAIPMLREAAKARVATAPLSQTRLMRLQIAEALVKLGDLDALETIRAALYPSRPEDLEATALAVQIIGQVGDRRSIDQLIYLTAMRGEDRMPAEVRLAAASSLAQLGLPQGAFIAREFLDNTLPALRAQAAYVLGETGGTENLGKLNELMQDRTGIVSVTAASSVLRITDRLAGQDLYRRSPGNVRSASAEP